MKITTFNVNGIRSAINKGLIDWLKTENPDVLCLQEIKLSETELVQSMFSDLGYNCVWYPAQKKGYSGVGLLSKEKPTEFKFGIGIDDHDNEGRVILASFSHFQVISAYFPSGTTGDIRQDVKMRFLDDIYDYIHKIISDSEKPVLICGDVNICHKEIDIHNPKSNANSSGFLPSERAWVGKFIDSGFIDCFRFKVPDPHHYTWWSYRAGARQKNLGWRIDYIFASQNLESKIMNARIHSDVFMSDHCPVTVNFDL